MPSAGFEPAIPKISRLQTYALDSTATGIGKYSICKFYIKLGNFCFVTQSFTQNYLCSYV